MSEYLTPLKAIRARCLDCCCGSSHEVKLCTAVDCALYPYRTGHNPYTPKRTYTEAEKAAMRERLAAGRAKQ